MAGITLSELLKKMIEMGGSDLHITTNSAPRVRVHGKLRPLDMPPLTAADTKSLAYSVLTDAQKHRFEENLELDFSFGLKSLARFRGNVFNQRGAVGAVFRTIPWEIKGFEALGLPLVVKGLCDKPRGLVLVTGPTGSGKSTTLAAMLDKINGEREEHMITIERNRPLNLRDAAHEFRVFDHQPYHRRLSSPSAAANTRPALHGARRHPLSGAPSARRWARPRYDHGDTDSNGRDPQPRPRGQDSPDLFGNADGHWANWNADF